MRFNKIIINVNSHWYYSPERGRVEGGREQVKIID